MRHRGRTLLQGLLAVFAALIAIGVTPAFAAEPPATSKIVTPNGDGTYTLSLSVTGKSQASQEQSKADVIVVLDTSTSMSEGIGNGTRIQVARQAVNSLAQELLANNTDENPDAVTLSLVTFDNYATTKITGTTAYATFSNAVPSSVQYNRGTNWEDALKVANAIQTRDGADVYVIFVSDGNPTFRDTHGGSYGQTSGEFTKHTSGTGLNQKTYYGSGSSDNNGLNLQYAKSQALAIAGEGKTLFSVGVFGNVSNMQSIAQVVGQSNNYYSASDSAALNAAFANIINTITHNLAYSSVKVTDGLTSLAASALVSGTADGFTYTQTKNGVTSDWNDAPAATFAGSTVSWDLSSLGSLEHGVTYTVSFRVWPSQEAIDKVAEQQNSGTTTGLPESIVYNSDTGAYGIKTNTAASVAYTQTSTTTTKVLPDGAVENDDGTWTHDGVTYTYANGVYTGTKSDSGIAPLNQPDPMPVDTPTINVSKEWVDSSNNAADRPSGDITLNVQLDGTTFTTVTLNPNNNYQAEVHVPYGITASGEDLTTGHSMSVTEGDVDERYELSTETIRPMLVDGVLAMGGNGDTTLTATNTLKSSVKISKSVTSDDGTYPADANFVFSVTVTTPDGSNVPYTVFAADGTKASAGTLASGKASAITLAAGQYILIDKVPTGSTYSAAETSSPAGWTLASLASDGGSDEVSGNAVSGTIAEGNIQRGVTYTNKFTPVESSPTGAGNLTVTKTLAGRTLEEGQFSFTLTALDGAPEPASTTVTNAADGTVSFGSIKFDKVGVYTYKLGEKNDAAAGYTYDTTAYTLVATVTANANTNALEVAWSIDGSDSSAVTFDNSYAASGSTTINATKTLTGRDMAAGEFTFKVTDAKDNVVAETTSPRAGDGTPASLRFGTFSYSIEQVERDIAAGIAKEYPTVNGGVGAAYHYTVSEETAGLADKGVTPTVNTLAIDVIVTDNGNGTLNVQVNYPQGSNDTLAFQNQYKTGSVDLVISGSKQLVVSDGLVGPGGIAGKYTFELVDADGKEVATTTNQAGGTIAFPAITFTDDGTYTYTVTESGTIPGVTNDADATKTVTVRVTDDGLGHLAAETVEGDSSIEGDDFTFTNTYGVENVVASDLVEAAKVLSVPEGLTGPGDIAGKYTFTVEAVTEGAPMPVNTTVENADGEGTATSFGEVTYTKPGTYVYRVTESGSVDGVTNDAEAATGKTVTVVVTDNGDGTMSAETSGAATFTNTYVADPVTLSGDTALRVTKKVVGHDASTGFAFTLAQSDNDANRATIAAGGSSVVTDVLADGDEQTVKFDQVTFSAPGTYHFTITEEGEDGNGWTCDHRTSNVTVTVTDNGTGQLVATVDGNDPVVTNSYTAQPVTLAGDTAIQVTKEAHGHSTSEVFGFVLTPDFDLAESGVTIANDKATTSGTIADGGAQTVAFGDVTFTKAGVYRFHVNETPGSAGGWSYSTAQPEIVVVVTDNNAGQLVATYSDNSNNPTFENYYTATGSVTVSATKALAGRAMAADEFAFTIKDAKGGIVATATNPAANDGEAAALSFRALEFNTDELADDVANGLATANEDGTFTYSYLAAEDTAALPGGVKAGAKSFDFTVTVSDNGDGTLAATVNYPDGASGLSFTNSYEAKTATAVTLDATKTLTGRDMTAGEFDFKVTDIKGNVVATATNDAAGDGTAANLVFTYGDGSAEGLSYSLSQIEADISSGIAEDSPADPDRPGRTAIYRYNVFEDTTALPAGVNAVKDTFSINVLVVDNGDGTLSATVNYPTGGLAFMNSYDADDAEIYINGAKRLMVDDELAGPGYITGKYEFTIAAADGTPMPETTTVPNQEGGNIEFGPISYNAAGTYTYTITESGTVAGVTNDPDATKTVTVKVTDEGGYLVARKVDSTGAVVEGPDFIFTNTYGVEDNVLSGDNALRATKMLEGRDLKAGEFTFSLTSDEADAPMPASTTVSNDENGNVVFGDIAFTQANVGKTYRYFISEDAGREGGVTYDTATRAVTVEVVDNGDGTMSFNVTGNNPTITNTYTTNEVTVDLGARKTLTGATLQDNQFEFQIASGDAAVLKSNDAKGNVSFFSVTYTLRELADVAPAADGTRSKTFIYTVTEVIPSDAVNGVKDGIKYDEAEHVITVKVTDNGKGELLADVQGNNPTFNNVYTSKPVTLSGDAALMVTKQVTGFDSSESYAFSLTLASGDASAVSFADGATTATTSSSIKDGATETASFGAVTFSKVGTYTFNVTEAQGSKAGWTYDKSSHVITVNVADNGRGQLVATVTGNNPTFENSYEASESDGVVVVAQKVLSGAPLMAGEFSFQLVDADGNVVREATNATDGSIVFDPITYAAPGTYTYTLREVAGSNPGMTYDSTAHTVIVVATDDGTGQIHAAVTSLTPTFTNSYASGVDDPVVLTAKKVLEGRRLEAGQFSFQLLDENGKQVGEQVTNDASGSIQFSALRYSQDDFNGIEPDENGTRTKTVTYTAHEVVGNAGGYTYSQNVATYKLELIDTHDGKITATPKDATNTTFTNIYGTQPVTAKSFSATKVLEGRGLAEGEFEFQLTAADGTPMPATTTATNAADGTVTFSPITYHLGDLAGETSKTFTYTISEVANGKAGVTYDEAKHTVSVTVTDNGDGTLSASDPVYDEASAAAPTFTNAYKAAAKTVELPMLTKVVSGDKPEQYPTFGFVLEPLDGAPVPDGEGETSFSVEGAGSLELGSITFDKVGTYSYKVYELAGNAGGWTYDGSVYTVTYTVIDDGSGVLQATSAITKADGTASDAVTFENVYTAPEPEPKPEPEPEPAPVSVPKAEPKKPAIPNTGDATQTALPAGLAVAAVAVLTTAVVVRRKSRNSK